MDPNAMKPLEVETASNVGRVKQSFGSSLCHSPVDLKREVGLHGWEPPVHVVNQLAAELDRKRPMPFVHEVWQLPGIGGSARMFCGGLLVTGPAKVDMKFAVCAWTSLWVPAVYYFFVCSSFLWEQYPWVLLAALALLVLTVFMMLITSFTDPGIIPRPALQLLVPGLQEEVAEAIGLTGQRGGRPNDILAVEPNPSIMAELEPKGYWWCRWCRMIQPPRAKHCRDCNCCVLREDHHCPFLNNCIGQRNYAFFYGFVVALCALAANVVSGMFLWLHAEQPRECFANLPSCFRNSPSFGTEVLLGGILMVVVGTLLVLVCGLGLFHLMLILRGRTTREVLTGRITGQGATLFAARGKSLLHAREQIRFPAFAQDSW